MTKNSDRKFYYQVWNKIRIIRIAITLIVDDMDLFTTLRLDSWGTDYHYSAYTVFIDGSDGQFENLLSNKRGLMFPGGPEGLYGIANEVVIRGQTGESVEEFLEFYGQLYDFMVMQSRNIVEFPSRYGPYFQFRCYTKKGKSDKRIIDLDRGTKAFAESIFYDEGPAYQEGQEPVDIIIRIFRGDEAYFPEGDQMVDEYFQYIIGRLG